MLNTKIKHYLTIISLAIIFYIPMFIRSSHIPFIGNDGYYYLNYIFYDVPLQISTNTAVHNFLFSLFPLDLVLIKLIMLFLTITSLLIFYETIELIKKNRGLLASLFLLSAFWFSWIFLKFENDLIAFPFCMISLYFLVKHRFQSKYNSWFDLNMFLSILFLFIAVMIWHYAVLYLIAFLFLSNYHRWYILGNILFLLFIPKLIRYIFTFSFQISENAPIKGLLVLCFFCFLYLKDIRLKESWVTVIIFTILVGINFKIIYILIPILFLSFSNIDLNLNINIKYVMLFLLILFYCFGIYQNFTTYPTNQEYELLTIGVTTSKALNKELYFQWSVGYWVIWNGYDSEHFGTIPEEKIDYTNKIVLTKKGDEQVRTCQEIKSTRWLVLSNC